MWNIFPDQLEPLLLITLLSDVACKQRDRWSERASDSGCLELIQPQIYSLIASFLALTICLLSLDLVFLSQSFEISQDG